MLARLSAVEFVRAAVVGRTCPLILNCEAVDGSVVPVYVKFSASCEQREVHLAREVLAACFGGDLGLPLPEPYLVDIPDGWSEVLPEPHRDVVSRSSKVAFGSRMVTGGYSAWTSDTRVTESMVSTLSDIFAFDALIQNPDRRPENPNCLVNGEKIRIIDHEMAFSHRLSLGWRPPWVKGGLNWLERKNSHIFMSGLKRHGAELQNVEQRLGAINAQRLENYRDALPIQWANAGVDVDSAMLLIGNVLSNIPECLAEIKRVVS